MTEEAEKAVIKMLLKHDELLKLMRQILEELSEEAQE